MPRKHLHQVWAPTNRVKNMPCFGCGRFEIRDQVRRPCSRCYANQRRWGTLPERSWDLILERLVVITEAGCWEYMGSITDHGYGAYRRQYMHRLTYEQLVGPIPEGWHTDHLCRNRCCCNPEHLEAVTPLVNAQRGAAYSRSLDGAA